MSIRQWAFALGLPLLLVGATGCDGSVMGSDTSTATEIVAFEASPGSVSPGDSVTLSWSAVNAGRSGGVPYCTLQWTERDAEPSELLEVACEGSLEFTAPLAETTVQFMFSALRRSGVGYESRTRTVTVAGDPFTPIEGFVVPPAAVALVTTVSGTVHGWTAGEEASMSLIGEFGGPVINFEVDANGRFDVVLPTEPHVDGPIEPVVVCGAEMMLPTLNILLQRDGPDIPETAWYLRTRPVQLAGSDTPDDEPLRLEIGYSFSDRVVTCRRTVVDDWGSVDQDIHLRPGWNVVFSLIGTVGGEMVFISRTGEPAAYVPWVEQMLGPP